jgi:hypothetical protein
MVFSWPVIIAVRIVVTSIFRLACCNRSKEIKIGGLARVWHMIRIKVVGGQRHALDQAVSRRRGRNSR